MVASVALAAEPAAKRAGKISPEDTEFINAAASGGMMEVQLGREAVN
jgi:hypothetical protein